MASLRTEANTAGESLENHREIIERSVDRSFENSQVEVFGKDERRKMEKEWKVALTFDGMVDIMVTLCPRAAKAFINA